MMPFIAKHAISGERIDITLLDNPRQVLAPSDCLCQLCGTELRIQSRYQRVGAIVRAHFYHTNECTSAYEGHAESADHLGAKSALKHQLTEWFAERGNPQIEFEVPILMNWRAKGRVADLLVTWANGWREVHEVQLASTTPDEIAERTNDYKRAGFDVVWWLGKSADTVSNRRYCQVQFGQVLLVSVDSTDH